VTIAAVIGLGTMGPGIAATLARGGMLVRAHDVSEAALRRGPRAVEQAYDVLERLGTVDRGGTANVSFHASLDEACRDAALVIENVSEKLELKAEVLKRIDCAVGPRTVIASDTSGIPITKLQANVSNPGRVVGMHWSNPPHIIPMIEVIAGAETDPTTVEGLVATVKGLNLLPVVVKKDVAGFVENRILYALLREAIDLVEAGIIDPEGLDTCVSWGIGYKLAVIGPMALLDMAGLDIYQAVGSYLNKELAVRPEVSPFVTDRIKAGRLGIKSGGGIFDYTPDQIKALAAARAKTLVAVRKALEARE
jgi:3-hydroxybutyryl-CoA dehydrogenase/5-formyl-3-hydroxy-2-methylpyridine 4-carboxylate dehydrogenase